MKHLFKFLTIILAFNITNVNGQGINDIEKDSVVKIANSDLSLIYYKKTTAVWHNFANFYVVEPTKNWFTYLHAAELLVEIDFKHKTFFAIVEDELTGGYKRFSIGNDNFSAELLTMKDCHLKKNIIKIDTHFFDQSFNKIEAKHIQKPYGTIGLKINRNNIVVTDYQIQRSYSDIIMSIKYPGEDSITSDGEICYKENGFDYSISKTGIYNTRQRNWLLPRKYNTIEQLNSELITNGSPTNLKELNSQVWRKKRCKWKLESPSYSSIEKVGSVYVCRTKIDEFNQSSYLVLDKNLKAIGLNDFYNFDLVESVKNRIKVTPLLSSPHTHFILDFTGQILN